MCKYKKVALTNEAYKHLRIVSGFDKCTLSQAVISMFAAWKGKNTDKINEIANGGDYHEQSCNGVEK